MERAFGPASSQVQQQIPFGNDRKKSKDKCNGNSKCNDKSKQQIPPGNDRKKSKGKCNGKG